MSASPDLSEFMAISRPKKAPCQVGVARSALPADEQAQLDAACAADKAIITTGAIRQWLGRRDQGASLSAITHHRTGSCSCSHD